jgi:hypothetical protein
VKELYHDCKKMSLCLGTVQSMGFSYPLGLDLRRITKRLLGLMLADKDTSVWTHCNYFQYLTTEKYFKLDGCLGAQVGSHTIYKGLFKEGAKLLEKAYNDNERSAYIYALNYARTKQARQTQSNHGAHYDHN